MRLEERGGASLGSLAARRLNIKYPSLTHAVLSAMPVTEVVTTNYDRLFEIASRAIGRAVSVLPHAPERAPFRWLLKMHGCIDAPDDIELTRQDSLRYEQHRAVLAGIVQELLITHQLRRTLQEPGTEVRRLEARSPDAPVEIVEQMLKELGWKG